MGQIQSHPFVYALSMSVLALKQHRWVVVTQTAWPTKPKVCINWHFTEKFADPRSLESLGRPLSACGSSWPIWPFRGHTGKIGSSAQQPNPNQTGSGSCEQMGLCLQTSVFVTCFSVFVKRKQSPNLMSACPCRPLYLAVLDVAAF